MSDLIYLNVMIVILVFSLVIACAIAAGLHHDSKIAEKKIASLNLEVANQIKRKWAYMDKTIELKRAIRICYSAIDSEPE